MTTQENPTEVRIFNEIIDMRRNYLGIHDWGHPRYPIYPYPARLCLLSDMNRVYVLREIGNMEKYLEIEREINSMPGKDPSPVDKCIYEMTIWTQESIKNMKPIETDSTKEKIVLSLLCYGKDYTDKCLNYAFKSMMSEGNLKALCQEKTVIFHIQTDEKSKNTIENSPIVTKMKALGAIFEYCLMSDSLVEQIDFSSVYWLVGAAATLGIEYARANRAGFHHTYPDIVYNDIFFSELVRVSKQQSSILSPAHRSDQATFLPSLKPYETDEAISIPSADLMALGLNAMHMCHWPTMVNNRTANWVYPQSHTVIWETPAMVYFNCPHLNALWLSPDVISAAPQRFYISLDSELDFLCQGDNFYIPQEDDYLYLVEFSNQGKQKVEDFFLESGLYANYFWKLSTNRDNFKFFTRPMKTKINRALRTNAQNVMDESAVVNEMVFLFNTIQSKDPGVGTTLIRPRTHLNRIFGLTQKSPD